jgi:hypothetical protein
MQFDIAKDGHLLDLNTKGRLYKSNDGAWRANSPNTNTVEWIFYNKPIYIVNVGHSTGQANVLQVMISRNDITPPTKHSYFFTIGGGDLCHHTLDNDLNAIFVKPENTVLGVWHYSLPHWP